MIPLAHTISEDRKTLTILASSAAREALRLLLEEQQGREAMYTAFERLICNSELQWTDPEVHGDLTDAPILGIWGNERWVASHRSGDGTVCVGADHTREVDPVQVVSVVERWGYMNYAVRDPVQDLVDTGRVEFIAP